MIGRATSALAGLVIALTVVFLVVAEIDRRNAPAIEVSAPRANAVIQIEIRGAVVSPGVYRLREGDRVIDAIERAGGLLPEADLGSINQAGLLVDGQQITIPLRATEGALPAGSPGAIPLVDLNRATRAELMSLPGVGEVRATAIIDYRNLHGPFQSVDELLFVPGISSSLVESIKRLVTVAP